MATYAQIENGYVVAITVAEKKPSSERVVEVPEGTIVRLGYGYDSTTGDFYESQGNVPRHITTLAFINRFADEEYIAVDMISRGETEQAAIMRMFMMRVDKADYIDLDRQDTREGVQMLEYSGLLGEGRATEILDAPIAPEERPSR